MFLFWDKKAIPDIWSSNWNWVFTCFNIVDWLYVVQFRESSWQGFWNFERKTFGAIFWLTLYINVATFRICNFYTLKILFDWNNCFVCSNFPLLKIMRTACFFWLDNLLSFSYMYFPRHVDMVNVAMDIWTV